MSNDLDTIPPITLRDIAQAVSDEFEVSIDNIKSHRRHRYFARPRQVVMFLAWTMTRRSTTQIGHYLDRDHTTILHGIHVIENNRDPVLHEQIRRVTASLLNGAST